MGRRGLVLAALAAVLTLATAVPSGAQIESGPEAVSADKAGWWNSLQGVESGTPAAPIGGVYPGFPQQATGAPAGTFASGLRLGEVDKVSAVGIIVDAPQGATVEEFTMTLTESADPAANNGSSAVAAITACPIVAFWVEVENGRFNGRPEADCNMAAMPGERDEEGRWKFDLKIYGQALLSETSTLGQNGVALFPTGAPPETFQVTWAGLASDTPPLFTFRATGGAETDDAFGGAVSGDTGFGGSSSTGDFGATTFGDEIRTGGFDSAGTGEVAQQPVVEAPATSEPGPPVDQSLSREVGNIAGNLPPYAVLGFLALLAIFAAVGLAVGRPTVTDEVLNRRGGVSRALAARRATKSTTLEAT